MSNSLLEMAAFYTQGGLTLTFEAANGKILKTMCQPGIPAGTCGYLRVMVLLTLLSYIRMRIVATSLRLMESVGWNVPFASEPVKTPAR